MRYLGETFVRVSGSRRVRPVAAWVEKLERRELLTLQVSAITAVAGRYFSGAIASFSSADLQGTLADYQATIYWTGASNLITGGSIAPNGTGNYIVYASNVYPKPGTYPVNVLVTGANNTSVQATGTATVLDAPLSTSPSTFSAQIQVPDSGTVATFQTSNSYATTADFTATINWGDGTAPTQGSISSVGYATFGVVGQHTYASVGTYPITVTIVSLGGQSVVVNSEAIATALPVTVLPTIVTGSAGQSLGSPTVATFLDPYFTDTAGDFQAVINWGDATASVGLVLAQGNGVFSVVGDHTYQAPGTYSLSVQVIRKLNAQQASGVSQAQIGSPSPNFAFSGGLAAVPGNGGLVADARAITRFPTFDGQSAAFAIVQLFARPLRKDRARALGTTVADPNGRWSLIAGPLAPGNYQVTAVVTPPAGYAGETIPLTQNGGVFFIGAPKASHAKARAAITRASEAVGMVRHRSGNI